jgi:hypothetical protein
LVAPDRDHQALGEGGRRAEDTEDQPVLRVRGGAGQAEQEGRRRGRDGREEERMGAAAEPGPRDAGALSPDPPQSDWLFTRRLDLPRSLGLRSIVPQNSAEVTPA